MKKILTDSKFRTFLEPMGVLMFLGKQQAPDLGRDMSTDLKEPDTYKNSVRVLSSRLSLVEHTLAKEGQGRGHK